MPKGFVFDGNWSTQIELPKLATLKQEVGFWIKEREKKTVDSFLSLTIQDDLSDNPDPSESQMNAINSLLNHEDAILYSLFEEIKKQYPALEQHQRATYDVNDEDIKEIFPELKVPSDLENIIQINSIEISLVERDNYAFVIMNFDSLWGFSGNGIIVIHQDKVVQFNNYYEWYLEILGADEESLENCRRANNVHIYGKCMYFYPHPKYNQLKPTQEHANELYPSSLIYENKNEEFIKAVENNVFNINIGTHGSLLGVACRSNNEVLFKYILSKEPININDALTNLAYNTNKYLLNDLLTYGVNSVGKYFFLEECIKVFLITQDRYILLKIEQAIKALLERGTSIQSINGRNAIEFIKASKSENAKQLLSIIS